MDGKVAAKDQVAAILDLLQRVVAAEIDGLAVLFGKLRSHHQGPILQAGANDLGAQSVGGSLQRFRVSYPHKGVISFTKRHPGAAQLLFDEMVSVEVIGDGKGEKGPHAQSYGSEHRVANVEVVMGVAGTLAAQDAVVRIGGGILGHSRAEAGSK